MAMKGARREQNVFVPLEASVSIEEVICDGSKVDTPFEFEAAPGKLDENCSENDEKRDSHV
jgi:hypothetical protein